LNGNPLGFPAACYTTKPSVRATSPTTPARAHVRTGDAAKGREIALDFAA
jgi:hypothetical protein